LAHETADDASVGAVGLQALELPRLAQSRKVDSGKSRPHGGW